MNGPVPVVVPRENVNDESATLVAWLVPDGETVEAGRPVAQIETSKAVVDVEAPSSGVLRHRARPGQDVPIGEALGAIGESVGAVAAAPVASEAPAPPAKPVGTNGSASNGNGVHLAPSVRRLVAESNVDASLVQGTGRGGRITKGDVLARLADGTVGGEEPAPVPQTTRFSREARDLITRLGLDPQSFEGRGLVRARDVVPTSEAGPVIAPPPPTVTAPAPAVPSKPVAASGIPTRSEDLSRAKRTEGKYLRSGFESTIASVVTVACPTRGFRAAFGPDASALIAFEAARLLRKYPALNAYHDDGRVFYYEEVNVGFAVDAGKGLKVPVVRGADRKGVAEIAGEMGDLVVAYLGDDLKVEALSGGTFTITDLSGEGVVAFHPLINRGQSAILGICAEELPAGGGMGTFNLVLAFDHQLAEGRSAARFLGDLRDRLVSHESSILEAGPEAGGEEPRCSRCLNSCSELGDETPMIATVRADGSTRYLCVLCLEGWN